MRLAALRIVPVVDIADVADAVPVAAALVRAGLPCLEITLRTNAGPDGIRRVREAFPELLLGAGTVVSADDAAIAAACGADFAASPGTSRHVIQACQSHELPVLPGVTTASDIMAAMALGVHVVKFFPAEASGGLRLLSALSAAFPSVRFVPTGGLSNETLGSYLARREVLACGGSWLIESSGLVGSDLRRSEERIRQALTIVASTPMPAPSTA